jgi:hypothetical protein
MSFQPHVPAALPESKSPRYQLDKRLGEPQSRSGRGGEEKKFPSLPPSGIETRTCEMRAFSTDFNSVRQNFGTVEFYLKLDVIFNM